MTNLKCNLCETGEMEYVQVKKTAIYVCEQCPNLQLEYYNLDDINNLQLYLKGELKALTQEEIYHYLIAEYIGVDYEGDERKLGREVNLITVQGTDLVTNIYESHSNIDYDLLEKVINDLDEIGDFDIYTEIKK